MNVMLTGELPAKKLAVQKPFHFIIQKCIQMDAKNRYESVEEIQLELTNKEKTMSQKIFDIVRKIPGFRSGEFRKELVACAYYFIVIPYMFSDVFKYWNTSKFAIAWFADLLIFVGPYLFAFNIFGIDDKLFNNTGNGNGSSNSDHSGATGDANGNGSLLDDAGNAVEDGLNGMENAMDDMTGDTARHRAGGTMSR